jgi:hypothetical protein
MRASQAVLPEGLEEETIASMMTGEVRWTVPWAMWADTCRALWLHPDYTTSAHPGGTVQMRVERCADGFHAWPPAGYKYQTQQEPGFHSPASTVYIPVVALHQGRDGCSGTGTETDTKASE